MTACVPAPEQSEAPAGPAAASPARAASVGFTEVTQQAGIAFRHVSGAYGRKYLPETMGAGVAVLDYDRDGRPDLYFPNGTHWPAPPKTGPGEARWTRPAGPAPLPALYHNEGGGVFTDRTRQAGLAQSFYGMGAVAADYDNDGDADLFVTALGPDRLYRNDGGSFTEVGAAAGVADDGFGSSATFFDYDQDGDLDLFTCNYVQWKMDEDLFCTLDGRTKSYCTPESYRGESNRLFRNEGLGRFTDVSKQAGVYNPAGKSLGVVTLDFDADGWEDIAVANDTQPNYLYRNRGDGTFAEVGREVGIAFSESGVARGAMGIDAADYDHTGRDSLVIGNFSNEMVGLYHNEGSGLFVDDAPRAGVGLPSLLTLAFGCFFLDYDLDGHADIFVGNGHVEDDIQRVQRDVTYAQKPHLFRGKGDGTFEVAGPNAGGPSGNPFDQEMVARGAAWLDFDTDGDQDIVVSTNNGTARLLRNDADGSSAWLRISLEGAQANRDGIGARVRVTSGGVTQTAHVRTGASYCSGSELPLLFGLGRAAQADKVEVTWPGGKAQMLTNIPARRTLTVKQE